jgi:DNA (cytosine-5)-methyltransferase 1
MFRHFDLFSGIGGFALAVQITISGSVNIAHSDIEPYSCGVYHMRYPDSNCLGDVTKVNWNDYKDEKQKTIVTGGFPCQPHSTAGKRKASKDKRDLWPECVRVLRELQPDYALWENVPGLLTSEKGKFFKKVIADIAKAGYVAEWTTLSAAECGALHKRNRLWILCYKV